MHVVPPGYYMVNMYFSSDKSPTGPNIRFDCLSAKYILEI
jgi:hypothetical protein